MWGMFRTFWIASPQLLVNIELPCMGHPVFGSVKNMHDAAYGIKHVSRGKMLGMMHHGVSGRLMNG